MIDWHSGGSTNEENQGFSIILLLFPNILANQQLSQNILKLIYVINLKENVLPNFFFNKK